MFQIIVTAFKRLFQDYRTAQALHYTIVGRNHLDGKQTFYFILGAMP